MPPPLLRCTPSALTSSPWHAGLLEPLLAATASLGEVVVVVSLLPCCRYRWQHAAA